MTAEEITRKLHALGKYTRNGAWHLFASATNTVGDNVDVLQTLMLGKPLIAIALGTNYVVLVVEGGAFTHVQFEAQAVVAAGGVDVQQEVSLGIGLDVIACHPRGMEQEQD